MVVEMGKVSLLEGVDARLVSRKRKRSHQSLGRTHNRPGHKALVRLVKTASLLVIFQVIREKHRGNVDKSRLVEHRGVVGDEQIGRGKKVVHLANTVGKYDHILQSRGHAGETVRVLVEFQHEQGVVRTAVISNTLKI